MTGIDFLGFFVIPFCGAGLIWFICKMGENRGVGG